MAVELYSDEILPGSCCIERVGEGEILLAAGEEEEVLLVPPAVLKHHHGAHRAVKSPHPSVPICLYPHKTKEVNACTPGTLRAVLDVSRIMSMKQAFKPVTPITASVPGMGDAKSGKTCCPRQCLRGPVVIWGRALHCPGEHVVLLEISVCHGRVYSNHCCPQVFLQSRGHTFSSSLVLGTAEVTGTGGF